jgi:hypothetical protein
VHIEISVSYNKYILKKSDVHVTVHRRHMPPKTEVTNYATDDVHIGARNMLKQ